jgi:hypothetical protein
MELKIRLVFTMGCLTPMPENVSWITPFDNARVPDLQSYSGPFSCNNRTLGIWEY